MSINTKKGFTLVETVIALAVGIITVTMMVLIFTMGLKSIYAIKNIQELNSSAMLFLDRITYLIKRGEAFDFSTPGALRITLPDGTEEIIDATFFTDNNIDSATTNFQEMNRSIQLNFDIEKGSESFSGHTTIAKRVF